MKKQQKFYFLDKDDTFCQPLEDRLTEAKYDGLTEVTLIEAIPDNDNHDYVWCTHYRDIAERGECKKSICPHYISKSGRGVCQNRGKLYTHGKEVTFQVK